MDPARKEILNKLRKVTLSEPEKPDFSTSIYQNIETPLEKTFTKNLEEIKGHAYLFPREEELFKSLCNFLASYNKQQIYCCEKELQSKLSFFEVPYLNTKQIPENMEVGLTGCEYLIAHTGSVMISSAQEGGRQIFIYPPVHIVIANKNQLVPYLEDAYYEIQNKYKKNLPSQVSLISGPSRTADIEKTLILGAHGPRELHVFFT